MSNIATDVNIRKNVVDTWNYHIDFTKFSGGNGDRGMQMQVVTYLFQYSELTGEQNTPEYYFYLIHQCMFSPQNLWIDDHADKKGWYVRKYVVDSQLTDQSGKALD